MGLKRIIRIVVIVLFLFVSVHISAEAQNDVINYGRVSVVMPEITAEIKGTGYSSSDVSAMLGMEELKVDRVSAFRKQSHSTCAYVLLDLSTSMRDSFELAKKNVISYVQQMGEKDKIVLVTFGKKEVGMPLSGSETKNEIIEKVKSLKCDQKGTLLYEALDRVYQLSRASNSNYDREYVIVFSDGKDKQKGRVTYEEIEEKYKNHELPIYAYCAKSTSKEGSDRFGELARLSGGCISIIHNQEEFSQFLTTIDDVTLIWMTAKSSQADGKSKQLSIKMGDIQAECMVPIKRSSDKVVVPTASPNSEIEKDEEVSMGMVLLLVVIGMIVAGGIVVFIMIVKKRKNRASDDSPVVDKKEEYQEREYIQSEYSRVKHHIQIEDSVHLRMKVKTGRVSEQNIDVDVVSSLIIGRSDVCDIYIDDSKLSRQHFAIENAQGRLYIIDLQSRNGTTLNGIRVNSRMELHNGDKIVAGLSDIIITISR